MPLVVVDPVALLDRTHLDQPVAEEAVFSFADRIVDLAKAFGLRRRDLHDAQRLIECESKLGAAQRLLRGLGFDADPLRIRYRPSDEHSRRHTPSR